MRPFIIFSRAAAARGLRLARLARVNQKIVHVERDAARVAANRRQLHGYNVRRRMRLLRLRLLRLRLRLTWRLKLTLRLGQRLRTRRGRIGMRIRVAVRGGGLSDEVQIRVNLCREATPQKVKDIKQTGLESIFRNCASANKSPRLDWASHRFRRRRRWQCRRGK